MEYNRRARKDRKRSSDDLNILGGKQLKNDAKGASSVGKPGYPLNAPTQKKYSKLNVPNSKKNLNSSQKAKVISKEVINESPSLRQKSKTRTYAAAGRTAAANRRSGSGQKYFLN